MVAIGSLTNHVVLVSDEGRIWFYKGSSMDGDTDLQRQQLQEYEQYHQELMHTLFRMPSKTSFAACLIQIKLSKIICTAQRG